MFPPEPGEMPPPWQRSVAPSDRTFLIDGRADVLLSAALCVFRTPRALWADRIAKARRGGMNTIETSVAPDVFAGEGARDLSDFLAECARQTMYAVVRVDTAHRPFLDAVVALLAPHLWTRNGPVILLRAESEQAAELLIRGIDVPVLTQRGAVCPSEDIGSASLRHLADGACCCTYEGYFGESDAPISQTGRESEAWRAARRVAGFAQTFKTILTTGQLRRDLPATNVRASELHTPQNGAILFITNPDKARPTQGSVIPVIADVRLGPGETRARVHDVPLGFSPKGYLAAYAGLVKSEAPVLGAHVLPDPHQGARVYVYDAPGQTGEVVLWSGGDRAQSVVVSFENVPRVYFAGPSQIVALSTEMAGRTWLPPNGAAGAAPVVIGPDDVREHSADHFVGEFAPGQTHTAFVLGADGALRALAVDAPALPAPPALGAWQARERGRQATFTLAAPLDTATPLVVRVDGAGGSEPALWLNGRPLARCEHSGGGPWRDYYAPEPWLNTGENVLVLDEAEQNPPARAWLAWDEKAATLVRVAF